MARVSLRLPSRVGNIGLVEGKQSFKDATWAVAYGLTIWGIHADEGPEIDQSGEAIKKIWRSMVRWFKQFLP